MSKVKFMDVCVFSLDSQSSRPPIIAFGLANQIDCLPGTGMIEIAVGDLRKADNKNRELKKSDQSVHSSSSIKHFSIKCCKLVSLNVTIGPSWSTEDTSTGSQHRGCRQLITLTAQQNVSEYPQQLQPDTQQYQQITYVLHLKCVMVILFDGWRGWNVWKVAILLQK